MTEKDLIPVGKLLGFRKSSESGFLMFKPNQDFKSFFFDHYNDIFLVFADHRVRFVTIDCVRKERNIWLKLIETEVSEEVADERSVAVCLPREDIDSLHKKFDENYIIGFKVSFEDKLIGTVINIENFGAHNLIMIENVKNKTIMIPDVEHYVKSINRKEDTILLQNVRELLEI